MKRLKRFLCWIGWHSIFVEFNAISHDGASQKSSCKWCGMIGLIDSQGNLFDHKRIRGEPTEYIGKQP